MTGQLEGLLNAALTDRGDAWDEDHAFDTVKGRVNDYLGDQDAIEVMCREAGQHRDTFVIAMEHMGVAQFSRRRRGPAGYHPRLRGPAARAH